jgi:hypothetical protein
MFQTSVWHAPESEMLIEYNTPLCFHTASRQQISTRFEVTPRYNWTFSKLIFIFIQTAFLALIIIIIIIIIISKSCNVCVDLVIFL